MHKTRLLLLPALCIWFSTLCAQSDSNLVFYKHAVKVNLFQYFVCEPNLVYEIRLRPELGAEITLGTFFNPLNLNYFGVPPKGMTGVVCRINPKIYMGPKRATYFSPMLLLKYRTLSGQLGDTGRNIFNTYYDSRVLGRSTDKIVGFSLLFGRQKILHSGFIIDCYSGFGWRTIYDETTYYENRSLTQAGPCEDGYPCTKNDKGEWPSFHLGLKIGYAFNKFRYKP